MAFTAGNPSAQGHESSNSLTKESFLTLWTEWFAPHFPTPFFYCVHVRTALIRDRTSNSSSIHYRYTLYLFRWTIRYFYVYVSQLHQELSFSLCFITSCMLRNYSSVSSNVVCFLVFFTYDSSSLTIFLIFVFFTHFRFFCRIVLAMTRGYHSDAYYLQNNCFKARTAPTSVHP